MTQKKLWIAFVLVVSVSFAVLLYYGSQIYQQAPPIPEKVINEAGDVLFTGNDIKDGQNIWQSIGGQEIGTIWGMVLTSRPTGQQITCTGKHSIC